MIDVLAERARDRCAKWARRILGTPSSRPTSELMQVLGDRVAPFVHSRAA